MIEKSDFVPLAQSRKPLSQARLTLISSCGVHSKSDPALDVCHPFGDFRFRRVPSSARHEDLIIHQLKYPHDDADLDMNIIFPIEGLNPPSPPVTKIGSMPAEVIEILGIYPLR